MSELWYPFAKAEPTGNHGGPMEPNVVGMVHHVTAGPNDPGPWFQNPASQASSHFGIDTDGTLYQYVDMLLASWAQAAGNYSYWSVEVVGEPTTPDTDAQVATFGHLYAWCSQINELAERAAFGFTLADVPGQSGLGWHGMGGDAWGGHYGCPGDLRKAQRPAILAAAQGNSPQEDDMPKAFVCEDPATGGTWAVLTDDGEVDTADGAPYLGGNNSHPEWGSMDAAHPIVGIAPWKDPQGQWGYKIGEYDPTPPAGQGRVRYYRFPRNGTLRTVAPSV